MCLMFILTNDMANEFLSSTGALRGLILILKLSSTSYNHKNKTNSLMKQGYLLVSYYTSVVNIFEWLTKTVLDNYL
jgi:hypothetical protein